MRSVIASMFSECCRAGAIVLAALCLSFFSANAVNAERSLSFADILTDNMVLQRGKEIKCWGRAPVGSIVEILLTQSRDEVMTFAGEDALARSEPRAARANPGIGKVRLAYVEEAPAVFETVKRTAKADKNGRWEVKLGVHEASFVPSYLAARSGDKQVVIQNLLIGEVWIASGQSNMMWAGTRDKMWENEGLIFNGLRYAKICGDSYTPRESLAEGQSGFGWMVCEDGAVQGLSTIPYLFGQYLHRRLKVPVGIINIAQGGSFAREWCERGVLEKMGSPTVTSQLKAHDKKVEQDPNAKHGRGPATLFNARLYPIRHMTVAGVIYLQGENEALCGDLPQYVKTFPGVIASYRTALSSPDLPFGIITLQGMGSPGGLGCGSYSVARAIHQDVHERTPHTGYIVAHDIRGGIHPNWKRPLAERTVYWALRDIYKVIEKANHTRIKQVSFADGGALVEFETVALKDGQWGNPKAEIPKANDQGARAGFMIAGADRTWFPGRITVKQEPPVGLRISHPMVKEPVALRYAWDGWSHANLGPWHDPVAPYRTDDWPIVTEDEIYDPDSGRLSPGQVSYHSGHDLKNRSLELPLRVAAEESYQLLTKRYAHPRGILLSTLSAMQQLVQNFDVEKYQELAPELRMQALYNIPCRYWQRDKYTPVRQAKWGWLMERIIRLETLPQEMEASVNQPDIKAKLAELQKVLGELRSAVEGLSDADAMDFDTMFDKILPLMDQERARLIQEGADEGSLRKALSENPF